MKWTAPAVNAPVATIRTPAGLYIRATPVREIPAEVPRAIAEKFIRGFHFAETSRPAPDFTLEWIMRSTRALPRERSLQTIMGAMKVRDRLAPSDEGAVTP